MKAKKSAIADIIFPATCLDKAEIAAIKDYVSNKLGLVPRIILEEQITPAKNPDNEFPSYNAKNRFNQLYKALQSDSKLIWCARGGYGSGDLLPFLDQTKKIKQNKLFIGFSDITSIGNFLQQKWGWKIICAPVLIQLARGDIDNKAIDELQSLIFGEQNQFNYDLILLNKILSKRSIESEIVGGCISVLCGHFGGKYQINFADKILFLEDEGEDGERLDRCFRQIIEVILKTKKPPRALLLGNFIQANLHGTPKAENIEIAIQRLIARIKEEKLSIPVFLAKANNLGHSANMRPLLLGSPAIINFQKNIRLTVFN